MEVGGAGVGTGRTLVVVLLVDAEAVELDLVAEVLLVHDVVDHPRLQEPPPQLLGRVTRPHLTYTSTTTNNGAGFSLTLWT